MRIVLDTNIIVSALAFRKRLGAIEALWRTKRLVPLVSTAMLKEYVDVLCYAKFGLGKKGATDLLNQKLLPYVEGVNESTEPLLALPSDPDDIPFLLAAAGGSADCLVSGDRHLLELNGKHLFPILRPADFLKRYFPDQISIPN